MSLTVESATNVRNVGQLHGLAGRREEAPMPEYLGALTIVLLLGMVLTRVFLLKRQGVRAMKFGTIDKTDFLIPPFAFFYFYACWLARLVGLMSARIHFSMPPPSLGPGCSSASRASRCSCGA